MESQSQSRDLLQTADHTHRESREYDLVITLTEEQLEEISGGHIMVLQC